MTGFDTEEVVKDALRTIEKAYFLFGQDLAAKMESGSKYLLQRYAENPNFEEWDFWEICKHADLALYVSKEKGKNRYQVYAS